MPKSSANVPGSQPSIDRLTLTSQSVRGVGAPSGDQTGFCCGLLCAEVEPANSSMFNDWITHCFSESV